MTDEPTETTTPATTDADAAPEEPAATPAADAPETAKEEIAFFFSGLEIVG